MSIKWFTDKTVKGMTEENVFQCTVLKSLRPGESSAKHCTCLFFTILTTVSGIMEPREEQQKPKIHLLSSVKRAKQATDALLLSHKIVSVCCKSGHSGKNENTCMCEINSPFKSCKDWVVRRRGRNYDYSCNLDACSRRDCT